jgi:hypothetical protein
MKPEKNKTLCVSERRTTPGRLRRSSSAVVATKRSAGWRGLLEDEGESAGPEEPEEGRDEKEREGIRARKDVLLNPTEVRVLRNEGSVVGGRRVVLSRPLTIRLRPLLSPPNVGPRRVLKERAELALAMVSMRMPTRPTMLKGLTALMAGAVAARRRSGRAAAEGWRRDMACCRVRKGNVKRKELSECKLTSNNAQ